MFSVQWGYAMSLYVLGLVFLYYMYSVVLLCFLYMYRIVLLFFFSLICVYRILITCSQSLAIMTQTWRVCVYNQHCRALRLTRLMNCVSSSFDVLLLCLGVCVVCGWVGVCCVCVRVYEVSSFFHMNVCLILVKQFFWLHSQLLHVRVFVCACVCICCLFFHLLPYC
jgi:hypothetical protein